MSCLASARLPPRRTDPTALRQQLRFVAIARAASRYLAGEDALEIARTLAGVDADLVTADVVAASVSRRLRAVPREGVSPRVPDQVAGAVIAALVQLEDK